MKETWQLQMEKELSSDSDSESESRLSVPSPFFSFRCGSQLVGAKFVNTEAGLSDWLRSTMRHHRHSTSEVIGLCLLRGLPYGIRKKEKLKGKGSRFHPQHPSNALHFLSLCINKTDVLLYHHVPMRRDGRPDKIKELRDLLGDKRVKTAGVGLKADLTALEKEWGIFVANPIELKGVERGEKMEDIAETVLKVKLEKRPDRLMNLDWARYEVRRDEEALMYAARDAYLCSEVGMRFVS
ncbi:hypothetical protein LUZ60_013474 [Juncus effusus]|nr:hypothetical protein LUZ60_013474 [Juncus effusus]